MIWYIRAIKKYSNFKDRARRKEYWNYILFNLLFSILTIVIDIALSFLVEGWFMYLNIAYALFAIIPSLAVSVRRLHDVGKSGWMLFISAIPLIGAIWLLVLLATEGDQKENQFGENPKTA